MGSSALIIDPFAAFLLGFCDQWSQQLDTIPVLQESIRRHDLIPDRESPVLFSREGRPDRVVLRCDQECVCHSAARRHTERQQMGDIWQGQSEFD
jgi:hypothetical protein